MSASVDSKKGPTEPPTLEAIPGAIRPGQRLHVSGAHWPDCPVSVTIDGKPVRIARVLAGTPVPGGVLPDGEGRFHVLLATLGLERGAHKLIARSSHRTQDATASASVQVQDGGEVIRVGARDVEGEEGGQMPYLRARHFLERRFGQIGFIPPGMRAVQTASIRALRRKRRAGQDGGPAPTGGGGPVGGPPPAMPVPGVRNWNPMGPSSVIVGSTLAFSGRALALAIDTTAAGTMYLGTAGGGVWKTTDGGLTWSPKSDYQRSLAVGALAIDPNNHLRVFAGTGEYNNGGVGTYYGNGVLRSEDGGDTWAELGTTTFDHDEISAILFDTTDATGQRLFLSSSIGVYESPDGGMNWNLLRPGAASALVMVADLPTPGAVTLIAAFHGSGLWTATRTAGTWSAWTQIASAAFPASFGRIALGQSRNHPQTIYALFAGVGDHVEALARTDDGGGIWNPVAIRLNVAVNMPSSKAGADNHQHNVVMPAADLTAAVPAAHTYTTTSAGMAAHTHMLAMSAADMQTIAAGKPLTKSTSPDASGHQHTFTFKFTGQSWYNLHVHVHPDDTGTVYFGEVALWKNTTGGGTFERITALHTDNHGFAFDPLNPNIVWSCNDGGVYRSPDGGATWAHRNRDLGTLEYIGLALHPQWETVMLGGTQDNGTHRYGGHPAFTFSDGGDGGFAAIDPALPTRMYHEYVGPTFYRSDAAGAIGTWAPKNAGIDPTAQFYAPFALDPLNPNTCWFGGQKLWRSPDNADTWGAVTGLLGGPGAVITAIGTHPADSDTVYAATSTGRVYRVHRTGPSWSLADVTTTDLTAAPLPANTYVSDLAVDPAGTLWATIGSVIWTEVTGEFTNDHVWRLAPAAGSVWENRSTGLAQANPINSIVIDPASSSRLFCAGDVGVFRSEDAGGLWTAWDEGLPNAPVFDLVIHGPRRLLRAATHGRSIWERPIDVNTPMLVDLYIRDNILDSGRVVPSPDGQPHPFDPMTLVFHWQSIDIKVDAQEGAPPAFQTTLPIGDYLSFEGAIQHRNPRRNVGNRFYAQVHNRGVGRAHNVKVRGFFCQDAHAGLPPLPADFWTGGRPFTGTPSGPDWVPVGPTQTFAQLEAAEPGIAYWNFVVPGTANQHSCLLVVTTCDEDPLDGTGITSPDFLVLNRKQAALKNLFVEDPVMGMALQPEQSYRLYLRSPDPRESRAEIVVHWGSLPRGTRLFLAFEQPPDGEPPVLAKPEELKHAGVGPARDADKLFAPKREGRCGAVQVFDPRHAYELAEPKSPKAPRTTVIPAVRVPAGRSAALAINFVLPRDMQERSAEFHVVQMAGKRIVGGATYLLRPRKS